MVRFPRLYAVLARVLVSSLSPRSRMRQWMLRRSARSGWAAGARSDLELMLVRYASDVVSEWPDDLVALGMPARVRGRREYADAWAEFMTPWRGFRGGARFLIDLGDRALVLGHGEGRGAASGARVGLDIAQLLQIRRGLVARERFFTSWAEGMRMAGIDTGVLAEIEAIGIGDVLEVPPGAFTSRGDQDGPRLRGRGFS